MKAEEEATRKAEEEADARQKAADEARMKTEKEARRKAEEEAEAQHKAAEEARMKAEEEARRKAEEEADAWWVERQPGGLTDEKNVLLQLMIHVKKKDSPVGSLIEIHAKEKGSTVCFQVKI